MAGSERVSDPAPADYPNGGPAVEQRRRVINRPYGTVASRPGGQVTYGPWREAGTG